MAGPFEMIARWIELYPNVGGFLVFLVQGCLVVLLASLVSRCFLGHAALQHLIWRAVMVGLCLAGIVQVMAGGWQVAMPSAVWKTAASVDASDTIEATMPIDVFVHRNEDVDVSPVYQESMVSNRPEVGDDTFAKLENDAHEVASAPKVMATEPERASWSAMLCSEAFIVRGGIGVYGTVVIYLIVRTLISRVKLLRLARQGISLDGRPRRLSELVSKKFELTVTPEIKRCKGLTTPLVHRSFRPEVLVPWDFEEWSKRAQWTVVLHELGHVARNDLRWAVFSHWARILLWFHPAMRYAKNQFERTCELATDEFVVQAGARQAAYADGLLKAVTRANVMRSDWLLEGARGMASGHCIESRLRHIFSVVNRSPAYSRLSQLAALGIVVMAGATTVQLGRATAEDPSTTAKTALNQDAVDSKHLLGTNDPVDEESTVGWRDFVRHIQVVPLDPKKYRTRLSIRGQVTLPDGNVAPGADVFLKYDAMAIPEMAAFYLEKRQDSQSDFRFNDVFAHTRTDDKGFFVFRDVVAPDQPLRRGIPWSWDAVAITDDGQLGWLHVIDDPRINRDLQNTLSIPIRKNTTISGRFVSPSGEPIPNAKVTLFSLEPRDRSLFNPQHPNRIDLGSSQVRLTATTDVDGRISLTNIPEGVAAVLSLRHPDWALSSVAIATSQDLPLGPRHDPSRPMYSGGDILVANPATIVAEKPVLIRGTVEDEDGHPISGASIGPMNGSLRVITTDDGTFSMGLSKYDLEMSKNSTIDPGFRKYSVEGPQGKNYVTGTFRFSVEDVLAGVEQRVVLTQGVRVTGRVIAKGDGQPIEGIRIQLIRDPAEAFIDTLTNDEGRFALNCPKAVVSIVPTSLKVGFRVASSLGYIQESETALIDAQKQTIDLSQNEEYAVPDFVIERVEPIRIQVVRRDGSPATNAKVVLRDRLGRNIYFGSPIQRTTSPIEGFDEISASAGTDDMGQVELIPKSVPTSEAVGEVSWTDGKTTYAGKGFLRDAKDGVLTIELQDLWRLSGRVFRNGQPFEGVSLRVSEHNPPPRAGGAYLSRSVPSPVPIVTGPDGSYFADVPPDKGYSIRVNEVLGIPREGLMDSRVRILDPASKTFPDIHFTDNEGEIAGVVVDSQGNPVPGASVHLDSRDRVARGDAIWIGHGSESLFKTNERGEFYLRKMPEGTYKISVSGPRKPGQLSTNYQYHEVKTGDCHLRFVLDPIVVPPLPRLVPKAVVDSVK